MSERYRCNHCDWSVRKTIDIAHYVRGHFYSSHYEAYKGGLLVAPKPYAKAGE